MARIFNDLVTNPLERKPIRVEETDPPDKHRHPPEPEGAALQLVPALGDEGVTEPFVLFFFAGVGELRPAGIVAVERHAADQ
jgi:hypothetical protein